MRELEWKFAGQGMDVQEVVARQWGRGLALLLCFGMLLRFAFLGFDIAPLVQSLESSTDSVPALITSSSSSERDTIVLDDISATLFGVFEAQVEVQPVVQELPETELELTLNAVFFSGAQKTAAALISSQNGSSMFRIGDAISEGVVLKSISPDVVTIEQSGRLENIRFSQFEETRTKTVVQRPSSRIEPSTETQVLAVNGQDTLQVKLQALRQRYSNQ